MGRPLASDEVRDKLTRVRQMLGKAFQDAMRYNLRDAVQSRIPHGAGYNAAGEGQSTVLILAIRVLIVTIRVLILTIKGP